MVLLLEADAAHKRFDLILLDINMPGTSGFALLQQIRQTPRLRSVPVIMCTGSDHEGDRIQSRHLGAVGYLVKPPSFDRLRTILSHLPVFDVLEDNRGMDLQSCSFDHQIA